MHVYAPGCVPEADVDGPTRREDLMSQRIMFLFWTGRWDRDTANLLADLKVVGSFVFFLRLREQFHYGVQKVF